MLLAPILKWEKRERNRLRGEIARSRAAREVAEKRIERLKADAAKAKTPEIRENLQKEIEDELTSMPELVLAPRLFAEDANAEKTQHLLVDHDEKMSFFSDEGGIFQIMAGLYSNGKGNIDVFLKGHSGTPLRVDRIGRTVSVDRPAISFGLAIQPEIMGEAGQSARFRGAGLLARYLYAVPKNNVGHRDVRAENPIPPAVKDAWERGIFELLDGVARIAGVLALAEFGTQIKEVDAFNVQRATLIGELLLLHAEAAFTLMGIEPVEKDALAIARWLIVNKMQEFTQRQVCKAMKSRFRAGERLKKALAELEQGYVISPECRKAAGEKGGRPSVFRWVNPRVLSPG
jgi:putative DNA primase/helicase